ncbi:MAG: ribonuclease Y [Calditrichaeota bacterium]|nr:ribonuclease Y [Calditrichota bacterium]RQW02757.1 MAG: ribonuclease Y [Calditrichota bacterium]
MEWLAGILIGFVVGMVSLWLFLKVTSDKKLLAATEEAARILQDAQSEAESLKKEKLIEVQEELFEHKQKLEQEIEDKRESLQRQEQKLDNREIEIDRKAEVIEKKEKDVNVQQKLVDEKSQYVQKKTEELNTLISEQVAKLEEVSGLTREEARQLLIRDMEAEAQEEGKKIVNNVLEQAKLEGKRKAMEVVVSAIQQTAAEQSAEATVSVVTLPNDDMKGRIIGREGRNIRAFELVTGVDVIIDDTPEVVILSSFNSFRREIAKISIEKLILDGRIHPARIEEVVHKTEEEMKNAYRDIGEQAMLDVGVHGIPDEIIELIGKLKYLTSYGQNVLNHSLEVAHLAGIMATELGLDPKIAKRAGLMHDIGKAVERHTDSPHTQVGAEILKKYNENPIVVNAVECHHNEENASSPYTILVAAADSISGSRPGARRETLESFIKRMHSLENIATGIEGVETAHAIQAGREVRVIVNCNHIDDNRAKELAREIAFKIQADSEFPGQIKVTVLREYRAFEYAT